MKNLLVSRITQNTIGWIFMKRKKMRRWVLTNLDPLHSETDKDHTLDTNVCLKDISHLLIIVCPLVLMFLLFQIYLQAQNLNYEGDNSKHHMHSKKMAI